MLDISDIICCIHKEVSISKKRFKDSRPMFNTYRNFILSRDLTVQNDDIKEGKRRLKLFYTNIKNIEKHYLTLSVQQREIIGDFVKCCLIKLVGVKAYEADSEYFMLQVNQKTQQCLSIVITPRRFGKTTSVAIFIAALLMTIPYVIIAIFSTGRRASSLLLKKISIIIKAVGAEKRIISCNQETLRLQGSTSRGDTRVCHSYPSNVATLKGIMICECTFTCLWLIILSFSISPRGLSFMAKYTQLSHFTTCFELYGYSCHCDRC